MKIKFSLKFNLFKGAIMTKEKRNHNLYLRPNFIEIIKQAEFIQVTNHKWIKFDHQGEFIEFLIQYTLDENIITLKNQEQNNE